MNCEWFRDETKKKHKNSFTHNKFKQLLLMHTHWTLFDREWETAFFSLVFFSHLLSFKVVTRPRWPINRFVLCVSMFRYYDQFWMTVVLVSQLVWFLSNRLKQKQVMNTFNVVGIAQIFKLFANGENKRKIIWNKKQRMQTYLLVFIIRHDLLGTHTYEFPLFLLVYSNRTVWTTRWASIERNHRCCCCWFCVNVKTQPMEQQLSNQIHDAHQVNATIQTIESVNILEKKIQPNKHFPMKCFTVTKLRKIYHFWIE